MRRIPGKIGDGIVQFSCDRASRVDDPRADAAYARIAQAFADQAGGLGIMEPFENAVLEGEQLRMKVNREPRLRDNFSAEGERLVLGEGIRLSRLRLIARVRH